MGLISTIKGWLNIGGVSVKLEGVDPKISPGQHNICGKAILTTKSDKQVLSVNCAVVNLHKFKKDGEDKEERLVLGNQEFREGFEMKTGETREIPFDFTYFLQEKMRHSGGALGAMAKFGAMASGDSDSYELVVTADVKGTPLDPTASVTLKVVA